MALNQQPNPPANTKPVGATGVAAIAAATFLPLFFKHADPATQQAVQTFAYFLLGGGAAGAYFGMPFNVGR